MPEKYVLRQYQALPLRAKVLMTELRIREWYNYFNGAVFVSFSGGKDSTVLASLVHDNYPDVPLVFVNTGLEYPEIQAFARKMGAEFIRPKMQFSDVISKYGYPIISKENAEAIHYARMIRNSEGGGTTTVHHRKEFNNSRCDILLPSGDSCIATEYMGGYKEILRQRTAINCKRVYIKDEPDGGVQRLPGSHSQKSMGGV